MVVSSACSRQKNDAQADVYVVGWESNGTVQVARLWKNGSAYALSDGTKGAIATDVAVSGDDVYVSGGVDGASGADVATYWKNGRSFSLTDGTVQAFGEAIAVAGSDVYVAGYEGNVAMLWKNGVPAPLTDGNYDANALAVTVAGGDVYVAGYEVAPVPVAPSTISWNGVAKLWKNGVPTALSSGSQDAVAEALAVVGSDVHAAGWEARDNPPFGSILVATMWKNGVATALSDGTYGAKATGVAVTGERVFASGGQHDRFVDVARVWRGGAPVDLTSPDRNGVVTQAFADAIAATGTDVYAAGYVGGPAVYWKNGALVRLTGEGTDAEALGIAIVEHDGTVPGSDGASPAVIIVQPADQAVFEGQTALFQVYASGTAGLTYQWLRDGAAIPGANDSHFQTDPTAAGDDGAVYSVLVGNGGAGRVGSRSALLTVHAPLDLRFQWVGAPSTPRYSLGTNIMVGTEDIYSGTGSPLQVGGHCLGSSPMTCSWFYLVDSAVSGMLIDYRAGVLSSLASDWAQGIGSSSVVISIDFEDGSDAYAMAVSETSQLGEFTPVVAGTVALSDLQVLASSEGSQGRVLTAATFRGTGDVEYVSYGWTLAGSTTYEAKVVASSAVTFADDAASLAAEGYVITAFGSGSGDAYGVVMVGTRASGDTAPRLLEFPTGASSPGFAIVGYIWDGTSLRVIAER
jgi:hypothetical protein